MCKLGVGPDHSYGNNGGSSCIWFDNNMMQYQDKGGQIVSIKLTLTNHALLYLNRPTDRVVVALA